MKKLFFLTWLGLAGVWVHAQAPALINYQGVARNSLGSVIADQKITLRLTVHENTAAGAIVYQETRSLRTNNFGLFTIAIGSTGADVVQGSFASINWGSGGLKFLQVEIDPVGGSRFVDMGTSQLLSVPYSLYAGAAAPAGKAGGDLSGVYPNPVLADQTITSKKIANSAVTLNHINTSGAAPGQVLGFDGTRVVWSTPAISGTAGGDLTGTYPGPSIASGAITSSKIKSNAVTTVHIADSAITNAKIAYGIAYSKLTGAPTALPPTGTSGGDLTGMYPNPSIAAGVITSAKVADGAITDAKISSVSYTKITGAPTSLAPNGAAGGDLTSNYPNPTIASGAVTNTKLADNSISTQKIQDGAIGSLKIADGSVLTSKVADGAITTGKITDAAISTTKLADGSVTDAKINTVSYSKITGAPATLPPSGTAGGDLTGTYPNPIIANMAVTTTKIADNAVTDAKVANGISYSKLSGAPIALPPTGAASGDLTGTYPNPVIASGAVTNTKLADAAVSTLKIQDGAVTTVKVADGAITDAKINTLAYSKLTGAPTALPPTGTAGGDLSGTYPNPAIGTAAVTTLKIADNAVTDVKLASGISYSKLSGAPTSLPPNGAAGGDLSGTYPNPTIATGAVTNAKLADNAVSTAKIQDGAITASKLDPSITFGGSGSPSGSAGGDLSGNYPNPNIASGAVTNSKIANGAVVTPKIADGAVTTAKLSATGATAGQVLSFNGTTILWSTPATGSTSGTAGGDLSGTYPNPVIAPKAVTASKIADGTITDAQVSAAAGIVYSKLKLNNSIISTDLVDASVTTTKLADGAVTDLKVASGISYSKLTGAPTSLPPSGTAGGDLTGTYPNPTIADNAITTSKIGTNAVTTNKISATGATTGQVLTYNGTGVVWSTPAISGTAGGDLTGTYPNPTIKKLQGITLNTTAPTTGQVLKYDGTQWTPAADNTGAFALPYTQTANTATPLFALTNQGASTAIEGTNSSTTTGAVAVLGRISATAPGVDAAAVKGLNAGTNVNGAGVLGQHAGGGAGIYGLSQDGAGVFGTSNNGNAGYFDVSNAGSYSDALYTSTNGYGNGITSMSAYGYGLTAIAMDPSGAGVFGYHMTGGEGVLGYTASDIASGVVGRNDGNYAGVKGLNYGTNGIGVLAQAQVDGTALVANVESASTGNPAVFQVNGVNVARIDNTGKAFFNGGTQAGGADVAEFFDVAGTVTDYEAGDVLIISADKDRSVEKSATPYSNLVAGVYATKPGVLLTEKNAEQNQLNNMVPMGVIGVIPTKVCMEGGSIKRGDMLVTSSIAGVAMKADLDKVKVGQVIGKALQDYSGPNVGKINVLVSIK